MKLGIMQGRLSPPEHGVVQSFPAAAWESEFSRAQSLGLSHIEWVFDRFTGFENPIFSEEGRARVRQATQLTGIAAFSLCADYFRDFPLKTRDEVIRLGLADQFDTLMDACAKARIVRVMIPYVDHSKFESRAEIDEVAETLAYLLKRSPASTMTVSLETNLAAADYVTLLRKADCQNLKVNYDIGDAVALGFDPEEEIAALGDWIVNVHVKDRARGGGTVPLGTGGADFPKAFRALKRIGYNGGFVLQGARDGDELQTVRHYRQLLEKWLSDAGFQTPSTASSGSPP